MKIIENETLRVNVIFKKYLETQKTSWEHSKFSNRLLF